jgi:lipopolysaccharide export system permease protein
LRLLQRYFLREMAINFVGVTLTLAAILFIYQVGAVLVRAAALGYPHQMVLELIGLGAIQTFTVLLPPLGLLLGIVLALGRLYADSEMVAARACGFSVARGYLPVLALAIPVAGLCAWFSFSLAPRAAQREVDLRREAVRVGAAVPIEAGSFRSLNGGRTVVYARAAEANGQLEDVFIKRTIGPAVEATVARRAQRVTASDGITQTIELFDGEVLKGIPGDPKFRILRFAEQSIPITPQATAVAAARIDAKPTAQLFKSTDIRDQAQLQWRLGLPLMALVVSLCAVPIGRLRPRQGRYARIWAAVLLFAVYAELAQAGHAWLARGSIPARLGLWWVHGLFLLFAATRSLIPWMRYRLSTRRRALANAA